MIAAINDSHLCPTGKKMKTPSKGKRKIEIKRIEDQGKRQVTFSKRRAGWFKKAGELSLLCGTQMAVLVESPAGNFFTFGHPDVDLLIHRYLTGCRPAEFAESLDDTMHHHLVESMNRHYSELCKELDAEKKKKKKKKGTIGDDYAAGESADLERVFWWEGAEEGFDDEKEIEEYMMALEDLKANLLSRAEDLSLSLMANPSPSSYPSADSKQDQDNIAEEGMDSAPVSWTSDDLNMLQETGATGADGDDNNNAAATATAAEEEEEWMNRVMAMMEEEGCDHHNLEDELLNGNNFWRLEECDEQFINFLID